MKLSPNFALSEFTASKVATKYGISNHPNPEQLRAIVGLVAAVLQPLRWHFGKPVKITSGFRSKALNQHPEVKGSSKSQHLRGEAADIKVQGVPSSMVITELAAMAARGFPIDQAILYHPARGGHVHVSYTPRRKPRHRFDYQPPTGRLVPWTGQ